LQSNPDSPDVLQLEWCLLAYQFAFVPGLMGLPRMIGFHDQLLFS
jgi:hypothetical protein